MPEPSMRRTAGGEGRRPVLRSALERAVTGDSSAGATALFSRLTTGRPAAVWSAPGRVNLMGEHTDYNDGFVLPFAIQQRTSVAVGLRTDRRIRVASAFDRHPVEVGVDELEELFPALGGRPAVADWAGYPLGVAWALTRSAVRSPSDFPGADLAIASDVPIGAGLASSAALEGAVAGALNDAWQLGLDKVSLAQIGRQAENEAVGVPTGIMDQLASMLGQPDAAILLDCRTLEAEVVDLGLEAAGLHVLVIDTGVQHPHSTGGYGERRAASEYGAAVLGVSALRDLAVDDLPRIRGLLDAITFRRVRHVITENQRVLDTVAELRAEGPYAIGSLLTASHASMRDDFEISVPELDTAVATASSAGALGARMTGGGFGGAAIALVPQARLDEVTAAVSEAFADARFAPPKLFTVRPSAGAARDL